MVYQPAIPGANDRFPQSQVDISDNFTDLNTIFGTNHIALNSDSNLGKHTQMQLVEGAAPATAANEIGLYASDTGTQPDLFVRPESNGTAVRLSGGGITAAVWGVFNGATGNLGPESYNISGIVRNSAGNYTVSFTRNFANADYIVIVTPNMAVANIGVNVSNVARAAGNVTFEITASSGHVDPSTVNVVLFGTLA
jgi:hypothetical protein